MKYLLLKFIIVISIAFSIIVNLSCSDKPTEPENSPPVVSIVTPEDNTIYFAGDTVIFTATAIDPEDGELTDSSLIWVSDFNGQIGIGNTININSLIVNTHKIILTATDSNGDVGVDTIMVTIQHNIPIVTITSPADSSAFSFGDTITFTGSAIDKEDGLLSGTSLVWTSNIDGQIGTGTTCTISNLSNNIHTITLTATDSENNTGTKNIINSIVITFEKTFGGANSDEGFSVKQSIDNGYIITGTTHSFGAGSSDVYLIKTDFFGNLVWEKFFGTQSFDGSNSVCETSNGDYIISGYNREALYLLKTNCYGDLLWERTFSDAYGVGNSITTTTDDSYIITGTTTNGEHALNPYLIKINNNGSTLWEKTYDRVGWDYCKSAKETNDGGYIISGYTQGISGAIFLIKTDINGNRLWEKSIEKPGSTSSNSIIETTNGGYLICGQSNNDVILIKTDDSGNLVWERTFGEGYIDNGFSVIESTDGCYVVSGYKNGPAFDLYLIKVDINGNLIWEKSIGGTGYEFGLSIENTFDGGYIIGGSTSSLGAGDFDIYLLKTDSEGNVY